MSQVTVYHNKLVRDGIPSIIEADKGTPNYHILEGDEYEKALREKFQEEIAEMLTAKTRTDIVEEIADVMELLRAYALLHGIPFHQLTNYMEIKRQANGGFERGIFLESVDRPAGVPHPFK